jgi:hypothetical protein
MIPFIGPILSAIVSPVTNYLTKKSDNKTAVKQQQVQRVMNADDQVAEWERIQAESGKHSWKDEFWTIVLAIPAIGCFIPGGAEVMTAGFIALEQMPTFFQYWLGVAVLTSFGVRITKR